jgi:glutamate dehydrogenase (NAD(P)+)
MTVYAGPVVDMAVNQFAVIADHLAISFDERDCAGNTTRGLFP